MHDDAPPALYPSATELWQYAQTITTISTLAARIRGHLARARERHGRLAFADDEHAARQHEARQHPPIRAMTDQERLAWQARVPATLAAAAPADGTCSVWTARMVDPNGEWALEAHTRSDGGEVGSLFVVCRDAPDALALTRYLREHGAPDELARLHQLATSTPGQASQPAPDAQPSRRAAPAGLSEAEWETVLRRELPTGLADRIVVTDPAHPHHTAWRELHQLANDEVARVGADPARLAGLVRRVPRWREDVHNPPALAHWAITQARAAAGYAEAVTAQRPTRPHQQSDLTPATAPRLVDVRTPEQAQTWARSLDGTNPAHRVEAKQGFGRWGSTVDAMLAQRFPGLIEHTNTAVQAHRDRHAQHAADRPAASRTDPATLVELAADVARLDPARPIDRRAAHVMLGRVPVQIDRLLAEKFGHDPQFADKLHTLYPEGLPEADAAAWRNRATGADLKAATNAALVDDPRTPQREDIAGHAAAVREHGLAAQQRGVATAVAGQPPTTVRQPVPTTPAARRRL